MADDTQTINFHDQLLYPREPSQTCLEWYTKWVTTYEKDLSTIDYNGPQLAFKQFVELNVPKNSKILDIAAGTGIVGCLLKSAGYTNVDALDGSPDMLEIAKQKNCYQNIITSFVAKDIRLPIDDKTYDHIILVGCFCPGHISQEAFPQILRVIKSGGFIVWSMDKPKKYEKRDPLFSDGNFEKYIQLLVDQNKWQFVEGYPKKAANYSRGNEGLVYAMKVL